MSYKAPFLTALFIATITSGCVNISTANVDPGTNVNNLKTMYVQQSSTDQRGVGNLIADKLRTKGVQVTTGTADEPKAKVDALVTYKDVWIWDWSTYLLDLTILMKDQKTDQVIASGNSRHGSMTRLTPPEMVSEVVEKIYSSNTNTDTIISTSSNGKANLNPSQTDRSGVSQLQNLKKLLDQGLISKSEYEAKKAAILNSM